MTKKRTTMKDVAKLAGVTQATVSYVINNSANISDEVKQRVNEAIQKLNYTPNYAARALKTNSSTIVGIILPDIVNQYYSGIIEYLENLLIQSDYHTMVYITSYNAKYESDIIQRLLANNVHSIIVLYQFTDPANWDILKNSGKPVIALEGGSHCTQIGIPNIQTDNFAGGHLATKYLLNQQLKKIAYINQTVVVDALQERYRGHTEAMKEADCFDPANTLYLDNEKDYYQECCRIGAEIAKSDYEAIITTSDLIAMGLIRVLKSLGKRVPEDFRVIGYDNIPPSQIFIPAITTIAQPLEEICSRILDVLFPTEDKDLSESEPLTPSLLARESA
ncbi:transcriptional regulator [Clostridium sp. SY8519]|uniref:LacI family DNA-binding transcriptional regulator n=1 Tax=Clostridium sp. (strain SY8519) TaxID=1042156 RepID=UPI0002171AF1|nr:LacI family DNA-binding transcriptional regulator [Clostridium sp. SY8519]BAK47560.1 transcriptional regulator [Clostridium sp. SY8519]